VLLLIQDDSATRKLIEVLENLAVVDRLLVPGQERFLHLRRQQTNQLILLRSIFQLSGLADHQFQSLTIMAIADTVRVIGDTRRLLVQVLAFNDLVRVIDIQLEIRHDRQMVPKDMLEIVHVAQVGKHISHDIYNRVRATFPLLTVLNRHAIIHHILDVATIFGQHQSLFFRIILHSNSYCFPRI